MLQEVAAERGVHAVDLMLDLSLAHDLQPRFRMAIANTDEAEVAELLRSSATVLGLSDAGAHLSQLCDACFSTHLLSHWVREKGVLSLEEAVRIADLSTRGAARSRRPRPACSAASPQTSWSSIRPPWAVRRCDGCTTCRPVRIASSLTPSASKR